MGGSSQGDVIWASRPAASDFSSESAWLRGLHRISKTTVKPPHYLVPANKIKNKMLRFLVGVSKSDKNSFCDWKKMAIWNEKYRFEFLNDIRRRAKGSEGTEEVSPHRPQMDHLEGFDKGPKSRSCRVRSQRHERIGGQFGSRNALTALQCGRQHLEWQ